jgi:chromosomal replication initiator protein
MQQRQYALDGEEDAPRPVYSRPRLLSEAGLGAPPATAGSGDEVAQSAVAATTGESGGPAPAPQLWQAVLGQLQLQVTEPTFVTFLRDTVGVRYADGALVVAAPSDFATEWLSVKLRPMIGQALAQITGGPLDVRFEVLGAPAPPAPSSINHGSTPPEPIGLLGGGESGRQRDAAVEVPYTPPRLNERYTFETFVEGDNNRLALAACVGACERPGQTYNPVFLYGGVGLGKTHLLHAMGHALLARGLRVIYVTSEQFTNDMVAAIRSGRNEEFRSRYRSADLLLIDDIQFIAGKEGTMEEFFHTFNDMHAHGRQIVLTSDQPPKKVTGLQDRLISRFEWGLIADIQPPSPETRLAILQEKAHVAGRQVPEDVLLFIADRNRENVRELEGSLNRVIAYADLTGGAITLELALRALGETPAVTRRRTLQPEEILDAVAEYYGVKQTQLAGQGRDKRIAHARQVAMYLLREDAGRPLTEIGRILGKRDHTTVMYGARKIEDARLLDPDLRQQLADLRGLIGK